MFVSTNNTNDCTGMCNELGEYSTFYTNAQSLYARRLSLTSVNSRIPACMLEM